MHVLRLKYNILCIGQMSLNNYMLFFKKKHWIIINEINHQVIINIIMFGNRMYIFKILPITIIKCLKFILDPPWLWHKWCFHINFNQLKGLPKLFKDLPTLSLMSYTLCENYIFDKQHHKHFSHHQHHTQKLLYLVHTNIYGSMQNPSLAKFRYMLIFTDDFYRMSWLYLLQVKLDAFDYFTKFKTLVEN